MCSRGHALSRDGDHLTFSSLLTKSLVLLCLEFCSRLCLGKIFVSCLYVAFEGPTDCVCVCVWGGGGSIRKCKKLCIYPKIVPYIDTLDTLTRDHNKSFEAHCQ